MSTHEASATLSSASVHSGSSPDSSGAAPRREGHRHDRARAVGPGATSSVWPARRRAPGRDRLRASHARRDAHAVVDDLDDDPLAIALAAHAHPPRRLPDIGVDHDIGDRLRHRELDRMCHLVRRPHRQRERCCATAHRPDAGRHGRQLPSRIRPGRGRTHDASVDRGERRRSLSAWASRLGLPIPAAPPGTVSPGTASGAAISTTPRTEQDSAVP